MNWLEEMIARVRAASASDESMASTYPGYTPRQMMINQGPMGSPTQDPAQFSQVPYQTPYGPGQMFREEDLPSADGSMGHPLGYTPMWSDFRDSSGAEVGRDTVYRDVKNRANEAFPGASLRSDEAEWLNLNEMVENRNSGTATADPTALRRLMTLMALHGAKRTAKRGGK